MNREEYLEKAISLISNKRAKQEVKAELSSHLDDLTDFYLGRGCTAAEAEEKAVAEMGDGELVGRQLAALHSNIDPFLWIAPLIVMTLSFIYLVVSTLITTEYAGLEFYMICEPVYFLALLLLSNVGRRRKSRFLTLYTLLTQTVITAVKTICMFIPTVFGTGGSFRSPTIINLFCLLKGEANVGSWLDFSGIRPYFWVTVFSLFFYFAILVIALVNFFYSAKKNTLKRSAAVSSASEKASILLCIPFALLAVSICVQFTWGMLHRGSIMEKARQEAESNPTLQEIYIYESDEPTDISALSDYKILDHYFALGSWDCLFYIKSRIIENSFQTDSWYVYQYELPDEYLITDDNKYEFVANDYEGIFEYRTCIDKISFTPTKDYVYILPIYNFYVNDEDEPIAEYEYDNEHWMKTNQEHTFKYEMYDDNTLVLTVEARG